MLKINLRNREAYLQLQAVYIAAVREYMVNVGIKELDALKDITVEVDSDTQSFKIKESGLGSRISYKTVLTADKDYDSEYDIFDYYCKYNTTNEIVLPSYFGYDVTGMLGYFKTIEFSMNSGFTAIVDNYKYNDSYLTNYVIPVASKLETALSEDVKFDNVRAIGSLKGLCRAFSAGFSIENEKYGGAFRQKNKKRRLTRQQEEIKEGIMTILNTRLLSTVYLFNYIKASDLGASYSNRLYSKPIKNNKGEQGCIVTFVDGGN